MKKIGLVALFCFVLMIVFALSACTGGAENTEITVGDDSGTPYSGGGVAPSGIPTGTGSATGETGILSPSSTLPAREKMLVDGAVYDFADKDTSAGVVGEEGYSTTETNGRQAGLITASAWDDNQYYSLYKDLFVKGQTADEDGKFVGFVDNKWWFDTTKRVKITVKEGENAVVGATVTYYKDDQTSLSAVTNAKGEAFLFPQAESGTVHIKSGENETTAEFTAEERELAVELVSGRAKDNVIKLMFVVDVTGSMGDELYYLKNELADVIHRVAANNEGVRIDLALLFYRDDGDDEKFAYADFKTVTDESALTEQVAFLSKQNAMGGGDYEEAVDEAVEMAVGKDWGAENATRMIFFVLDAPPHSSDKNISRCAQATVAAAAKGIRICPILCSGADSLTEYATRQGALYTGGTFIFVTDDSGIGGSHHDPDIPNAVVEKLNELMIRLISGYHTGVFSAPVPYDQQQ